MNTLSSGHAASNSGGISTINSIESKALTLVAKNSPATPPSNEVKKSVSGPNFENTSQGNVISIDVQVKPGSLSSIDAIGPVNVSVGTQSSKNSIPTFSMLFLEEYVQEILESLRILIAKMAPSRNLRRSRPSNYQSLMVHVMVHRGL